MSDSHDFPTAVRTQGLTKRYGNTTALDAVDLEIPEGAVFVLVGANGAGKSTLVKVLLNLERANAGSAHILGMDTAERGADARAQVGYVPEHQVHGYGWMKCGRLIEHVAAFYPTWDAAYANRLITEFKVQIDRKVGTLSKGEARRLQLVTALSHRPPLLILDEPTDGLDPIVRKRMLALLAEHLSDSPTTVLISTHQIYEMESLADHVGVLRSGRLVTQMSRDDLQRTVRRYTVSVAEGWQAPPELKASDLRRSSAGREVQCTLVGEEDDVTARLVLTGAEVRDVTSLALEDAALVFLTEEVS